MGLPLSYYFVGVLMEHGKDFIIIGNQNAITYKEFFPLLKENRVWLGASIHSGDRAFFVPDDYPLDAAGCGVDEQTGRKFIRVKGVRWFTTLDIRQRHEELILTKKYDPDIYPKYDNYDAIEVSKTSLIPKDFYGVMGVPITFMNKYCPEQFEIIWEASGNTRASAPAAILDTLGYVKNPEDRGGCAILNGKRTYGRIFICRKENTNDDD